MKVKVVTDSGGLMSKAQANALGIDYLPLQVTIGDKTYLDGVDLTTDFLYDQMEQGAFPQTSLPPMGMIYDMFAQYKEQGTTDIVLVTLSGGLSSTNEKICIAAQQNGIHVHTLDIYSTLGMEKYMAVYAQKLVEQRINPKEIIDRLQESVDQSCGYLIVEDLDHLVKGGRLTPMAAKLGGMLRIKPILRVSKDTGGAVDIYEKVRTMSKAVKRACSIIAEDPDINADAYDIVLTDSRSPKMADLVQETLLELIPGIHIEREPMCAVINSHTGMGSIGIQYIRKVRGCE